MSKLVLVIGLALICGLAFLQYKTKIYWKYVKWRKWNKLQPELQNIRDIHNRVVVTGKKTGPLDKLFKSTKKRFDSSKRAYVDYIDFCNSKHLDLPKNRAELDKMIDTTEDALLSPSKALDKELEREGNRYNEVYSLVNESGERLYAQREAAEHLIEDIESLINSIANSPKSFSKDAKEIYVQKRRFNSASAYGLEQRKVLESYAKSAGAGIAAGAAFVSIAPRTAMWVATTFGTASTGTAIAELSGAAATNAALTWLGGGSLAAGGGGIAAGRALLAIAGPIGWGVAGTSLVVNVWKSWKRRQKIQEGKKEQIARLKRWIEALKETKGKIDLLSVETRELYENLCALFSSCNSLKGCDYVSFSDEQKQALGTMVNNTKALSKLLNKTIEG